MATKICVSFVFGGKAYNVVGCDKCLSAWTEDASENEIKKCSKCDKKKKK